jgi:hypothetical protein
MEAEGMRMLTKAIRLLRALAGIFPFTAAGLLVLALSGAAFWFQGIKGMDVILLAAGFVGLLLAVLMALYAALLFFMTCLRWKKSYTKPGLTLECEVQQQTGFAPPWRSWLPFLDIRWSWETPPGVEVCADGHSGLSEVIIPHQRGCHSQIVRKLMVRDRLGLVSMAWRMREAAAVILFPHRGALDQMPLFEALAGGEDLADPHGDPGGDRVDMRQYSQGDSPRLILWKNYARTRKLLVRVPERAVTAKPRSCAYLVAGEADEAGAGLARIILERGCLGENWRFGADGSSAYAAVVGDALMLLTRSGNVGPAASTGLPEFLVQAEKDGYAACFLIVPPVEGAWVAPVLSAIRQSRLRMHLYTAVDGAIEGWEDESRWKRFLLRPREKAACSLSGVARMAARFKDLPIPFLLADRKAGKMCGDVRKLLDKYITWGERRR